MERFPVTQSNDYLLMNLGGSEKKSWCPLDVSISMPRSELKPTLLFRTTRTHLEIVITWFYRKLFCVVFPPCISFKSNLVDYAFKACML